MKLGKTTPILRIFDEAKAKEFYVDFLGFKVDWEHRFEPGLPLYPLPTAPFKYRAASACCICPSITGTAAPPLLCASRLTRWTTCSAS